MEGDANATVACGAQIAYSFENAGLLHCRTAALQDCCIAGLLHYCYTMSVM